MLQSYFPAGASGVPVASPTVLGIAKLYTATGNNTDGSMDQNSITAAITSAVSDKVSVTIDATNGKLVFS